MKFYKQVEDKIFFSKEQITRMIKDEYLKKGVSLEDFKGLKTIFLNAFRDEPKQKGVLRHFKCVNGVKGLDDNKYYTKSTAIGMVVYFNELLELRNKHDNNTRSKAYKDDLKKLEEEVKEYAEKARKEDNSIINKEEEIKINNYITYVLTEQKTTPLQKKINKKEVEKNEIKKEVKNEVKNDFIEFETEYFKGVTKIDTDIEEVGTISLNYRIPIKLKKEFEYYCDLCNLSPYARGNMLAKIIEDFLIKESRKAKRKTRS